MPHHLLFTDHFFNAPAARPAHSSLSRRPPFTFSAPRALYGSATIVFHLHSNEEQIGTANSSPESAPRHSTSTNTIFFVIHSRHHRSRKLRTPLHQPPSIFSPPHLQLRTIQRRHSRSPFAHLQPSQTQPPPHHASPSTRTSAVTHSTRVPRSSSSYQHHA